MLWLVSPCLAERGATPGCRGCLAAGVGVFCVEPSLTAAAVRRVGVKPIPPQVKAHSTPRCGPRAVPLSIEHQMKIAVHIPSRPTKIGTAEAMSEFPRSARARATEGEGLEWGKYS